MTGLPKSCLPYTNWRPTRCAMVAGQDECGCTPQPVSCTARSAMPGRAVPGRAVPGRAVPGRAVPGRAVPGRAVPGRAVPGRAVPGRAGPGAADVYPRRAGAVTTWPVQPGHGLWLVQNVAASAGIAVGTARPGTAR